MAALSILLPTYKRAKFLRQAMESIRGQEFSDWELMIVDDGSTDETAGSIGDELLEKRGPTLSLAHATGKGIESASV